jgi:tetratricopeptide (TPR) repeat protein
MSSSAGGELQASIEALRLQAGAAAEQQDRTQAAAILGELLALDDRRLAAAPLATLEVVLDVVSTLVPIGDLQLLEAAYLKGIGVLQRNPGAKLGDLLVPLNNLMAVYGRSDQPAARAARNRALSQLVTLAEHLDEPLNWNAVQVLLDQGRLLRKAGNSRAVAILYGPVHRYMMANQELAPATRMTWLLTHGSSLVADGQHDAAQNTYRLALERAADLPAADQPRWRILFLAARGNVALHQNDLEVAEQVLQEAKTIAEGSGLEASSEAGGVYHNLAVLFLRRRERYDEAEELCRRALAITTAAGRQQSAEYAAELAQLAAIAVRKGELDRAVSTYREALAGFERAADTDGHRFAECLTEAGFVYLRGREPAAAVEAFERAWQLREPTRAALPPGLVADSLANVALARFEAGDFDAAVGFYQRALDLRYADQG